MTKKKVTKKSAKKKVVNKSLTKEKPKTALKAKTDSTGVVTMEVVDKNDDVSLENEKTATLSPRIDPETGVLTMVLDVDK